MKRQQLKQQCWVDDDMFQITPFPIPSGIQTVKNTDLLQIKSNNYYRDGKYLHMKFYLNTNDTNRYDIYDSLDDYFRLEVYPHNHEEETPQRIDQARIDQIKTKWPDASMKVQKPEAVKGSVSKPVLCDMNRVGNTLID